VYQVTLLVLVSPKGTRIKYFLILNQRFNFKKTKQKRTTIMTLSTKMSRASTMWDQAEKGFLTDAERIAKSMDVGGKGHLSREQAVVLGSRYQ
jgi:hypothetical protein